MLRKTTELEPVVFPPAEVASLMVPVTTKHQQEEQGWRFIQDDFSYCKPIFDQEASKRKQAVVPEKTVTTRRGSCIAPSLQARRKTVGGEKITSPPLLIPRNPDLLLDSVEPTLLATPSGL